MTKIVKRYAIIDLATNKVVNVTMWDGDLEGNAWRPPDGTKAEPSDTANVGDDWPA